MNSNVIKLLLGLCLFLLLILLIEWNFSGSTDDQFSGLQAIDEDAKNQEIILPVIELSKREEESFSTIVEKPLFIQGRRPVKEIAKTEGNDKSWGKIDDFVLVGIYSTADQVIALLREQIGSKEYLKKSEGDEISGWTLSEIHSDRVLLESEGKQQAIMLRKPRKPQKKQVKHRAKPATKNNPKPVVRKKKKLES